MNKYGLLLSNDPSKGAFEVGVWQALYQMHFPTACVAGGGLNVCNAALMAQGDSQLLYDFWHQAVINDIMQLNTKMVHQYVTNWANLAFQDFRDAFHHALLDKHFNLALLHRQLSRLINEKRIRQSETQLLIAVPDWNTLEPQSTSISDIPSGQLIDYLLRCAALPVFYRKNDAQQSLTHTNTLHTKLIDQIDGQQCTRLLFFETPELSMRKALKKKKISGKIVNSSIYLEPCSHFEKTVIDAQIKSGFLDCMKAFHLVVGKKYYLDLRKKSVLFDRFSRFLGAPTQNMVLNSRLAAWMNFSQNFSREDSLNYMLHLIKKSSFRKEKSIPLSILEICALKFKIERNDFYSPDILIDMLFDQIETTFAAHLDAIRLMDISDLLSESSENSECIALTLPMLFSLYTGMLSTAIEISPIAFYRIRNHLVPEDQLALFGVIYLNLMAKTL